MLTVDWATYTVKGFTDEETELYLNHIFKDKKDVCNKGTCWNQSPSILGST